MRRGLSRVLFAAVLSTAALGTNHARDARAGEPAMRIGLMASSGAHAAEVRRAVAIALGRQGFIVINHDELLGAAFDLEVSVDTPPGLRAVASHLQLRAFVETHTVVRGRQLITAAVIRDGATGRATGHATVSSNAVKERHLQVVEATFWKEASHAIKSTKGAAVHTGGLSLRDESPAAPRVWSPVGTLEVAVGPRLFSRSLTFSGDPADAPANFRTRGAAPALAADVVWRPLRHFGASLGVEQGRTLSSTLSSEARYSSPNFDYHAAALGCFRRPWGIVDLSLGGGFQRFGFTPAPTAAHLPLPTPEVWYQYLRVGASGRFALTGPLVLLGGAYYRHVQKAGPVSGRDWFPDLSVYGIEASVGLGYRLRNDLEARLQIDLRRYAFSFGTTAGSPHVADGAIDQYWGGFLGVAYLLGP